MTVLVSKLKEVVQSVLPIVFIVLLLHWLVTPLPGLMIYRFLIGASLIVVGLTLFLFGVDLGISVIGHRMGEALARSNRVWIIAVAGIILGFFISIAEPDLHILAWQVDAVTNGSISGNGILVIVSAGIAILLSIGLIRIPFSWPLYRVLTILYAVIFVLAIFVGPEFLAISFDASGATTGALTVPFVLALALGISTMKKDSKASEKDSFCLVAIVSSGAIIAMMITGIVTNPGELSGQLNQYTETSQSLFRPFISNVPWISFDVVTAMSPLVILLVFCNQKPMKMTRRTYRRSSIGLGFTLVGLILFLLGVHASFMPVGSEIGYRIATMDRSIMVIAISFILGVVTVLAEPAVHVLTHQIEEVTSGYVRRRAVLVSLAIGIGIAIALSMVRIMSPSVHLWHFLLPGYLIAVGLSYIVPKVFVGMAFDAGGVASGPMTVIFILAFVHGAAEAIDGANVLIDGFGMIAMVALMPIIALQLLGLIYKIKTRKREEETDGHSVQSSEL